MSKAEERALEAYPNVEQPVWDESYPKTLFVRHTERNAFIKGYEQAEKDLGWISVKDRLPKHITKIIKEIQSQFLLESELYIKLRIIGTMLRRSRILILEHQHLKRMNNVRGY